MYTENEDRLKAFDLLLQDVCGRMESTTQPVAELCEDMAMVVGAVHVLGVDQKKLDEIIKDGRYFKGQPHLERQFRRWFLIASSKLERRL